MGITIGDAILWIRGDNSKLDADLNSSEQKTKSWGERIKGQLSESMNFAMGQIMSQGINQLASGIENLASDVVNLGTTYAQQVEDIARLSGASVEDASRIIQVADDMRMSYADVETAMRGYVQKMQESGQAARLSVGDLANLSDAYLALAPGLDRSKFLMDNFGRSGLAMGKLMEQGGEKIRNMAGAVDDSLVMTQQGIDQAEDYRLAMDDWNDSVDGVKIQFAQALLPAMTDFANLAKNTLIPVIKDVVNWFTNLPPGAQTTVIAIGGILLALVKLGPALMGIGGIVQILGGAGGLFGGLAGTISFVSAVIHGTLLSALGAAGAALATVSAPVWILIAAIATLIAVIVEMGPAASKTFMMLADIVAASLKRAGYELGNFGRIVADWAAKLLTTIGAWFKKIGTGMVDGIKKGLSEGWNGLKTWISDNMNSLLDWVKDKLQSHSPSLVWAAEVGKPMAQGIGSGFSETLRDQVRSQVQTAVQGLTVGAAQAADNRTYVGQLNTNLTQTERRLLMLSAEDRAETAVYDALRGGL